MVVAALLAPAAHAGPVVTDTIPGQVTRGGADWAYKLDIIEVTHAARLVSAAPWVEFDGAGHQGVDLLHVAVYAEDTPGSNDWDVVFDSGLVGPVGAPGDFFAQDVDLPLEAGRRYAVGVVFEEGNYAYLYESGPGATDFAWGRHVGAVYVGENGIGVFPTHLENRAPGDVGYAQELTIEILDVDGDGATEDVDCDDADPRNFPGSPEWCDGADNDCDGIPDDNVTYVDWYPDEDRDGYGDDVGRQTTCDGTVPPRSVQVGGDCDDADRDVHPGVPEICDGRDEDCTGVADDDPVTHVSFADDDGDGFGGAIVLWCTAGEPPGLVDDPGDCDDTDADVFPGAVEVCDGRDQDCDAVVDDGLPTATWWADADGDGFGDPGGAVVGCDVAPPGHVGRGLDCDDADARRHPGADEVCDGVDDDCDGLAGGEGDTDGDGFVDCLDCGAGDASVYPGAPEACDGVDHDCDGVVPDRLACDPDPTEALSVGACGGCAQSGPGPGSAAVGILSVLGAVRRRRW